MKLQPKDLGILAIVVAIGIAVVFATTRMFGGSNQEPPKVISTPDNTAAPQEAKANPAYKEPSTTAN